MIPILVTLLLLMSDGTPASKAFVQCSGMMGTVVGSDTGELIEYPVLVVDSRGAIIFSFRKPKTIYCTIKKDGEVYEGSIKIGPEKVKKIYLQPIEAYD